MKRRLSAGAFTLAIVVTAGCGKNLSPFQKSPGDTLRTLFATCNDGRYSEVEPLLSESFRAALRTPQAIARGGIKSWCDYVSHTGTILKVEIVKEEVRGEGAVVTSNVSYRDSPSLQGDRTDLIKEGGVWRLTGSDPELAAATTATRTPGGSAVAKLIQANPDLELVSSDEAAGTVTIRNKKTNEVVTVRAEDIRSGKFKMSGR